MIMPSPQIAEGQVLQAERGEPGDDGHGELHALQSQCVGHRWAGRDLTKGGSRRATHSSCAIVP